MLYSEDVITADIVTAELAEPMAPNKSGGRNDCDSLSESVDRHIVQYFAAHKDGLPAAGLYGRILREVERPLILHTLTATRGNQIKAAQVLGLNRNTLRKKIRALDIQVVRGLR